MTPYYDDGQCVIYHGDCREVLPRISDVDMVFTSPPYNLGGGGVDGRWFAASKLANGYASHDDAMPQAEYDIWQRWVLLTLWGTLSNGGAIFYNHKPRVQDKHATLPTDYGTGLPLRQIIVWDRGTGLNFNTTFFLPKHEWIVVWAKDDWALVDQRASQVGDVWRVAPETSQRHPAPFPVKLPTIAIAAANPALVLDPFMGSGTTLRAAKDLGRRAIGIELSERYCEIAANRLAQGVLDFGASA
jgi:site-specific DNA-methyltransferase (adenine-specific)